MAVFRLLRHPAQNAVCTAATSMPLLRGLDLFMSARGCGLETRFRDGEVGETRGGDQASRMGHMAGVKITTFECDVRIRGHGQRQAEAPGRSPVPARAVDEMRLPGARASNQRGEGEMRRRRLRIEAGSVARRR